MRGAKGDRLAEEKLMRGRQSHTSFLIVTHSLNIACGCDRTFELVDGSIAVPGEGSRRC